MLCKLVKCLSQTGEFCVHKVHNRQKTFQYWPYVSQHNKLFENYILRSIHEMFQVLCDLFLPFFVGLQLCQNLDYKMLMLECLANDEMKIIWNEAAVG
jgi:hypothetical protein